MDVWTNATYDETQVRFEDTLRFAAEVLNSKFATLIEANDIDGYNHRLGALAPDIERTIQSMAAGDPALFATVHEALLTQWEADFHRIMQVRREKAAAKRDPRAARRRAERRQAATVEYAQDAPAHFIADYDKLTAALAPYMRTASDGFEYVDPSAPAGLVSAYRGLLQMAYANGWFRTGSKAAARGEAGKWYIVWRDSGAVREGPFSSEAEAWDVLDSEGMPEECTVAEGPSINVESSKKMAARTLPNVSEADVAKFVALALQYGYSISADEAHDILLMNGGFEAALAGGRIWAEVANDVRGSGDLPPDDVDEGAISMLIETSDPMSWYYRYYEGEPYPTDYDALIAKLRSSKNIESARRAKELELRNPGISGVGSKQAATQSEADAVVAAFPEAFRSRVEALKSYLVYGPGYNRNVTENVFTAARFAGVDERTDQEAEWFLRKAEAQAHYAETGEWIAPIHPREVGRQQTLDGGEEQYGFNPNVYNASKKTAIVLTDDQVKALKEVPAADLKAGDVVFRPSMGTIMRSDAEGNVSFSDMKWAPIDGHLFTVESNEGGMLVARDETGQIQSGSTADFKFLRMGSKAAMRKGAPFAGYEDFDDCVSQNSDKDDPDAYCGYIKNKVEDKKEAAAIKLSVSDQAAANVHLDRLRVFAAIANDGIYTEGRGRFMLTVVPHEGAIHWAVEDDDEEKETDFGKTEDDSDDSVMKALQQARDALDSAIESQGGEVVGDEAAGPSDADAEVVSGDGGSGTDSAPEAIVDDAHAQTGGDIEALDPSRMDTGTQSTMTYTLADGTAGDAEVTFVREENDVYYFDGPSGEFGMSLRDGKWVDSEGNSFAFSMGDAMEEAAPELDEGDKVDVEEDGDVTKTEDADDKDDDDFIKKVKKSMLAENPHLDEARVDVLARRSVLLRKALISS